ncbi:MAG: START domain-containing protein [Ferruginibacter sp.]|nr:START domain-containing protein [Cytophagales bacterium]
MVSSWLLLFSSFQVPTGSWKLVKDKNGVKVYTRKVEGSALKEFKAVTTVAAPLNSLVALLKDFESYPAWVTDCKAARQLKLVSPTSYYYYAELNAPWPVENRDMVVHFQVQQDSATKAVTCTMAAEPDYLPPQPGNVRIPKLKGTWQLTPQQDGTVEVLHRVHAESGGSIPAWLANSVMTDGPYRTLSNMRNVVTRPAYQGK